MVKHVLESQQFDTDFLMTLFERTKQIKLLMQTPEGRAGMSQTQRNKLVAMLFYEPSTRTRMSFDAAAQHLGASVIATENAKEFWMVSSEWKVIGRCVRIGFDDNAKPIRHYHWAIDRDDKYRPVVTEFWDTEIWTTARYRTEQEAKERRRP